MIRRQPFRKKYSFFLPAASVILALWLSFSVFFNLFGFRSLIISGLFPFQFATTVILDKTLSVPTFIFNLAGLSNENSVLKEKLSTAMAQNAILKEAVLENQRLQQALGFRDNNQFNFRLLPAKVIARSGISIIELNRGTTSGIKVDTPVIVKEGLVGRVVETSPFVSKVMFVTDNLSSVAAVDQKTRDTGLVTGFSPHKLLMKLVSSGNDMAVGDLVVTSPASSIFPAGIPIGTLSRVSKNVSELFYDIDLAPSVNFSTLQEVYLVI